MQLTNPRHAQAQILGPQTPGTPGAIDGEIRPPRAPAAPVLRTAPALRGPDPQIEGEPASRKFGLKRNPNPAAKRQPGSGQTRAGGYPGASAAGGGFPRPATASRNPRDLTASRIGTPVDPGASLPPLGTPSVPYSVAPGLPPVQPPVARRSRQEDDPYAPLGIRAGSMILRPALEVGGGYDTNARRSGTNARGSALHRTEVELNATSDWSRHQLDMTLRGAYTGYTAIRKSDRPEGEGRLALRFDATRDLTIDSELRGRIDTESPSSVNLPGGVSSRTPFYTFAAGLGATQRFGRLSLGLRSSFDRSVYADAQAGGVNISQEARNVSAYGLRLRAGYEVTPGATPFLEAGIDQRVHDLRQDAGGFRRDSRGLTLRLGSTFELARTLTGEIGAGYTFRAYEDARLAFLRAPVVDAQLTWSVSPLTTLNLRAQSEVAETTIANSSGALTYRGTATLTHAFLRNFIATATLGYGHTAYRGASRRENTLNAGLRLEYKFTRALALRGSYAFENNLVNTPGEGYKAHVMLMGIRFTP